GHGDLRPGAGGEERSPSAISQIEDVRAGIGGGSPSGAHCPERLAGPLPARQPGQERRRYARAHLKVATLNIRGSGTFTASALSEKWLRINQLVRDERVGILALQETHLDDTRAQQIGHLFSSSLEIVASADVLNATAARGVAFILNKRIFKELSYTHEILVPGRAMVLDLAWSATRRLRILNVYAPNGVVDNAAFWRQLAASNGGRRVDIMLGDMNVVDGMMDRLLCRKDSEVATAALSDLCSGLSLLDGWRQTHPGDCVYTYLHAATGGMSRLDRIYVTRRILKDADNWIAQEPGIETDHKLVSVEVRDWAKPLVGKGRWVLPTHLLRDDFVKGAIKASAAKLEASLKNLTLRTDEVNPQTLYRDFKETLRRTVRQYAKTKIPKLQKRLDRLRADRDTLLKDIASLLITDDSTAPEKLTEKRTHLAVVQDRLNKVEAQRFETKRRNVATNHCLQAETMTRPWIRANYT
ncbi:Endonuclease/exonuclease/phosphatase, partial [Cubamyces menziesii]